jgi:predicted MarR family transcription regulator
MTDPKRPDDQQRHGPIVSSEHLASEGGWQLSELEFGLTIANNAFTRWMTRCMAASGYPDLAPLDILVLHNVNHRARSKRLSDICFMLNIEDSHTVGYALKKLAKAGLVDSDRRGKEVFYVTSDAGAAACQRYREVREQCLVASLRLLDQAEDGSVSDTATLLRALSGIYDQAARAAASL